MAHLKHRLVVAVVSLALALAEEAEEEEEYPSDEYTKARSRRVFGAGIGVFLLVFFFGISCGICWGGALVPEEYGCEQSAFNAAGTLLFCVVALLLLFADPEPRYESREDTVEGYDDNFLGLLLVLLLLVVAAAIGVAAIAYYHLVARVEVPKFHRRGGEERSGVFDGTGHFLDQLPTLPA